MTSKQTLTAIKKLENAKTRQQREEIISFFTAKDMRAFAKELGLKACSRLTKDVLVLNLSRHFGELLQILKRNAQATEDNNTAEKRATLKKDLAKSETAEERTALLEVLDIAQLKIFAENEFIQVNKRHGKKNLIAEIVETITARFNDIDAGNEIFIPGYMGLPTQIDTTLIHERKEYITAKYESLAATCA